MTRCLIFLAALLPCRTVAAQDAFDWAVRAEEAGPDAPVEPADGGDQGCGCRVVLQGPGSIPFDSKSRECFN